MKRDSSCLTDSTAGFSRIQQDSLPVQYTLASPLCCWCLGMASAGCCCCWCLSMASAGCCCCWCLGMAPHAKTHSATPIPQNDAAPKGGLRASLARLTSGMYHLGCREPEGLLCPTTSVTSLGRGRYLMAITFSVFDFFDSHSSDARLLIHRPSRRSSATAVEPA